MWRSLLWGVMGRNGRNERKRFALEGGARGGGWIGLGGGGMVDGLAMGGWGWMD